MDRLPEPIHDSCAVEIDARRPLMLQREEGRALAMTSQRLRVGVPPDRLEQRVAGRDPLQVVRVSAVSRSVESGDTVGERRELASPAPSLVRGGRWRPRRIEGVREARQPA